MSEDKKKTQAQIALDQAQKKEEQQLMKAQMAALAEEAALLAAQAQTKPDEGEAEAAFSLNLAHHSQEVIDYYKKKFNKEPDQEGTLWFSSIEELNDFCQELAEKKVVFLGQIIPTNDFRFSCGNGSLYSGSLQEIKALLENEAQKTPEIVRGLAIINKALGNNVNSFKENLGNIRPQEPEMSDTAPKPNTPKPY